MSRSAKTGHESAQEARRKADDLQQCFEEHGWQDNANIDLQFAVRVCLAHCKHMVGMDQEALSIYSAVVKNPDYQMAGRLRVNMGNIYAKRNQWSEAIKQYRMALDQIPTDRQVTVPPNSKPRLRRCQESSLKFLVPAKERNL
jgi:intraflagellar transport protein 88